MCNKNKKVKKSGIINPKKIGSPPKNKTKAPFFFPN
jgi:hypothetical protein